MMANRNILRLALRGSLAALLISAPAHAQSAGKMMKGGDSACVSRTFSLLDTDGDGKISLAKIRAEQTRLIAAADPNGDGKLSVDEFRRRGWWFQELQTTTLFDLIDADGDQSLTAEEIANPSARRFKPYDKEANGGVTGEEVSHFDRHERGNHKHR